MYEQIQVRAINRLTNVQIDLTPVCEELSFNWVLEGAAGYLDVTYINSDKINLSEGDVVYVNINGRPFFYGWLFKKQLNPYDSVKIKVYDIKRYLAYKDTDVTGNETIDQLFKRVCTMANIKYSIKDTSSYIIPSKIHDGVSYNDIIQYALDKTFINNNKERFCMRANGDTLELININNNQKNILIGDRSFLTDYDFSTDIDNTYTAFKIQREVGSEEQKKLNEAQQILKRKNFTLQPTENIKKWGVLQYYEKKDSKWTDAQINAYLTALNTSYNKQTKKLELSCLGQEDCIVGNMIPVDIQKLHSENVAKGTYVVITEATHKITHNDWTMKLTVEIS